MIVCHGRTGRTQRTLEDEGIDEERQDQRMLDENDISLYNRLVLSNF